MRSGEVDFFAGAAGGIHRVFLETPRKQTTVYTLTAGKKRSLEARGSFNSI